MGPSSRLATTGSRLASALALAVGFVLPVLPIFPVPAAHAVTGMRLVLPGGEPRMVIDGFTREYEDGEEVFGFNAEANAPEESENDSKWGPDNDFNQIRVTWDKDSLYIAGEGVIWGNNMVILFDVIPGIGMTSMQSLNSWRRNFSFPLDFNPDLFIATWDGNTNPRLLIYQGGNNINDQQVGEFFDGAATFSQNARGRAMEFAIPWDVLYLGTEGDQFGTTATYVPALRETVQVIPSGRTKIKIAGVITAGGDGTGGPDSAPDNTTGHTSDGSLEVLVDNYATLDLDLQDDTGLGAGGPDGVADWGIDPRDRVGFKFQPPLREVRFVLKDVKLDRAVLAQTEADPGVSFRYEVEPPLDPADPIDAARQLFLSANVYDLRGRHVRVLYLNDCRSGISPTECCDPGNPLSCAPLGDRWDGRDDYGVPVPPGVYILRCELTTSQSRINRPIAVIR